MITRVGPSVAEIGASSSISFWLVSGGVGWLNGSLFLGFDCVLDCSARNACSPDRGFGARLLRRRSGTESVSPPSSSVRRVARSGVRWLPHGIAGSQRVLQQGSPAGPQAPGLFPARGRLGWPASGRSVKAFRRPCSVL